MSDITRRYSNQQLADLFTRIADLLEIKGEVVYKILAYRKAADSLTNLGRDVMDVWREGKLTEIPGVGKAIAEKIDELITTGKLGFLQKLESEVPPGLVDLLQVPDLGPKKAALFWKQLGVTNLAELEAAARTGKLRDLPGMGQKPEARILAGIEALSRRTTRTPLGKAWPFAQELLKLIREAPGVQAVEIAGSLRRMRATVGDIDLLAAAADSGPAMQALLSHPQVTRVMSQGVAKASVEFENNLRAQLWVHPPERFGTALQYATGSKDHNVRLRELALKRGLSLSDQAFLREDGSELLCAKEEEVYQTLGLPWIPPELREDHGEIQAALAGDAIAQDIYRHAGECIGIAASNVIVSVGPRKIVIGGGVAQAGELLLSPIRRTVLERVRITSISQVEITLAELGTHAGLVGAAMWAKECNPGG
jgi:DNA polymerase (family 10)